MTNGTVAQIRVDSLKQMYKGDSIAQIIFDYLADRQRNYAETTPERLLAVLYEKGNSVERWKMIEFFRKLENAGCGQYIEGRRGHRSRFEWSVKMHDVGQAARGTKNTVEEISPEEKTFNDEKNGIITHEFRLRPEVVIKLDLPVDLKSTEATRLSDWIKTLPFD